MFFLFIELLVRFDLCNIPFLFVFSLNNFGCGFELIFCFERVKNVLKLVESEKFDFMDTQWLDDPLFSNYQPNNKENKLG